MKYPQKNEDNGNNILDDSIEKEMKDPRVQAICKRLRHNTLSIFIINQDYNELPKKTIRANVNIYHIFKPNNFRDVLKICQDKSFMDMNLKKLNY